MSASPGSGGGLLKRPVCRPSQYFGAWLIEPTRFAAMCARVEGLDLAELARGNAERQAATPARAGKPYRVTQTGVAIISIEGPITKHRSSFEALFGGTSTIAAGKAITEASYDTEVSRIALRVDSPGGAVAGIEALGHAVSDAGSRKPVTAAIEDLCCSAALWIASQAGEVIATGESALIGSIGVVTRIEDSSEAFLREGRRVHVVASGPYKATGTPGAPVTEEQLVDVQREIDSLADIFVRAIARGRHMSEEQARGLADGRVWTSAEARGLGLIDRIAPFAEVLRGASRGGDAPPTFALGAAQAAGPQAQEDKTMPTTPAPTGAKPLDTRLAVVGLTVGRTKAEILAAAQERATKGFPRLSPADALQAFFRTSVGEEVYRELYRAPERKAETIKPAGNDLASLRAAALEEERLEGPGRDALAALMEKEAGVAKLPRSEHHLAREMYGKSPRGIEVYRQYVASRQCWTAARERYAEAMLEEELRPLVSAIAADGVGAGKAHDKATSLLPAFRLLGDRIKVQAARGCPLEDLEAGHDARVAMVRGLVEKAQTRQRQLAAAEFAPESLSTEAAIAEVFEEDNPRRGRPRWFQLRHPRGLVLAEEDLPPVA